MRHPTTRFEKRRPFLAHLLELRNRFGWYVLSFGVGTVLAYSFHEPIIAALTRPLNQSLFYSSPGGGFDFLIKVCLLAGFLFSLPVLIYQCIRFLEPLVPKRSRSFLVLSLLSSVLLMGLGVSFAYFISLPMAIGFLNGFATEEVRSLIMTNEYISFMLAYFVGFGVTFQMPLFLLILNHFQAFAPGSLRRQQKWVVLIAAIAAAVITPTPDMLNMLGLAVPLILLYEVSVFLVWRVNRKKRLQPLRFSHGAFTTPAFVVSSK
ncbi:MAG: twin-arginine translocase subunit TatC [Candidatus Moraniibacteriota bacterium]